MYANGVVKAFEGLLLVKLVQKDVKSTLLEIRVCLPNRQNDEISMLNRLKISLKTL